MWVPPPGGLTGERVPEDAEGLAQPLCHEGALEEQVRVRLELVFLIYVVQLHLPVYLSVLPEFTAERDRVFEGGGQGFCLGHWSLCGYANRVSINA